VPDYGNYADEYEYGGERGDGEWKKAGKGGRDGKKKHGKGR